MLLRVCNSNSYFFYKIDRLLSQINQGLTVHTSESTRQKLSWTTNKSQRGKLNIDTTEKHNQDSSKRNQLWIRRNIEIYRTKTFLSKSTSSQGISVIKATDDPPRHAKIERFMQHHRNAQIKWPTDKRSTTDLRRNARNLSSQTHCYCSQNSKRPWLCKCQSPSRKTKKKRSVVPIH